METDKRKCKVCNEEKTRELVGRYPDGRNKKFRDDSGKLWNGNVCGSCNVVRSGNTMKKIRDKMFG